MILMNVFIPSDSVGLWFLQMLEAIAHWHKNKTKRIIEFMNMNISMLIICWQGYTKIG